MNNAPLLLVVDDQDALRYVKVRLLRSAGYRVREAANGSDALAIAGEEPVDVAVLDVNLPDIHGFEVCRRLKSGTTNTPPVSVLQISNTAVSDEDRIQGLQQGADVYLTEPIHPQVLLATVNALLRTRRADEARAAAIEAERIARQQAESANRLKDEFLATLSHELRTPLNAMMGWIWQLQRGNLSDATRERALESLARSTRVQAQIINDLLDVSRIAKGKLLLELRVLDLEAVLEGAVEAIRDQATRRRIELKLSTSPIMVTGDAARLDQVISNLLGNAIKFTPDGGRITVSLSSDGDDAIMRVVDTGVGIEPAFQPHVFDQFRQAEGGTSRRHGGLGLGLSIVRQLVELHHGSVSVFSAGPGKGSTFTVTLPLAPDVPLPISQVDRTRPLLTDISILVVDDEEDVRDLLAAMLEASGARAATAASATAAIEMLAERPFDVLVSDIGLPECDGMQLLEKVRALGYTMPAIAVTAFASADDRQRILESGYQAHLAKPITPAVLVRAIAGLAAGRVPP